MFLADIQYPTWPPTCSGFDIDYQSLTQELTFLDPAHYRPLSRVGERGWDRGGADLDGLSDFTLCAARRARALPQLQRALRQLQRASRQLLVHKNLVISASGDLSPAISALCAYDRLTVLLQVTISYSMKARNVHNCN